MTDQISLVELPESKEKIRGYLRREDQGMNWRREWSCR